MENNFYKENLKKVTLLCILIICFSAATSCQNVKERTAMVQKTNTEKKYKWLPTECAPSESPIQIHKGQFVLADGSTIKIPSGRVVYNGWGESGSTYLVGEAEKTLPVTLKITWLSYTENKFYSGSFNLPKEKIQQLFEEGFLDRRDIKDTYSEILVGIGSGGLVSLWLLGSGATTLVDQFTAEPIIVPMEEFSPNSNLDQNEYTLKVISTLPEKIQSQINSNSDSSNLLKIYNNNYNWKIKLSGVENLQIQEVLVKYLNGEKIHASGTNEKITNYRSQAIPGYIKLTWENEKKQKNGIKISLDPQEALDVFKEIYKNTNVEDADFLIDIDKYNSKVKIYLENTDQEIEFQKAEIKVYPLTN